MTLRESFETSGDTTNKDTALKEPWITKDYYSATATTGYWINIGYQELPSIAPPIVNAMIFSGFKGTKESYDVPSHKVLRRLKIASQLHILPDPENRIDFLDDYSAALRYTIIENPPPKPGRNDAPDILIAHSLSGRLILELMQKDEEFAHYVHDHYAGVVLVSPNFIIPIARGFFKQAAIRAYTHWQGDAECGTTRIDSIIRMIKGGGSNEDDLEVPVQHNQINYILNHGIAVAKKIKQEGFPTIVNKIPFLILGGKDDDITCNITNQELVTHIGDNAIYREFENAGHHALLQSRDARKFTFEVMQDMLINDLITPPQSPHSQIETYLFKRTMGEALSRNSLTLEGRTSFLDPYTSLSQGLR